MPQTAPYGSWKSPLSAERAVAAGIGLGDVSFDGDCPLWQESRPAEKGRNVVIQRAVDGTLQELTPAPWNARTRVHEYGGRAYLMDRGVLFFSHFADQRLYRVDPGQAPRPITPEATALRYADLCPDARRGLLWAVREDHRGDGEARNTLVALQADGDEQGGHIVAAGQDFYAAPRLSPDGSQLAWLSWNHPDMPWDGCELWLAEVDAAGRLHDARRLAGSRDEAVQQPLWSPDGRLYFISDRSGWWNLYRWGDHDAEALCLMDAEFGQPFWNFGLASYAFTSATQLVCSIGRNAVSRLAVLDTASLQLRELDTPFSSFGNIAAAAGRVLFTGASPLQPASVYLLQLDSGHLELLRRGSSLDVDPDYTSVAQAIEFPTAGGLTAHAFYYPPKNADFTAPTGEKPPLLVMGHGGPTSMAVDAYRAGVQYWTSRGIAVLDVNYGGSSGFGRAYRQRLDGSWGVVDVQDCIHGAQYLAQRGEVDGRRLIIRGGSAGGYTTLSALAFHDVFACGTSLYGIGDLETLATDTHKFEARYLDRLVGPYPAARELYRARSPIHHLDGLTCPLILLQGAEDQVVPPAQSRRMHAALKAKGVPVAYLEFEGEQHGFRMAANIVRALEAEAYFYAQVFGFTLADAVEPVLIDNL
jgi:dipeptidyl aminopeptidase/acylaminoacyl peptidase